ncbi:hypothetical protein DLAC_09258 [Tieghemostelium lacteum]|uniref:Aquaporin-like protein n=1 Tax=Tieghemostelium lacteum TaxID=361077 RepID=A0A151Z9L7_TIELA|nr:hypothetical protein DLAC_09258 [Tieghemostelium lacteum]|eukprot:KYQ90629.1 hypothetical protein DLAC_09258 [Tieghemostelium lacteum]
MDSNNNNETEHNQDVIEIEETNTNSNNNNAIESTSNYRRLEGLIAKKMSQPVPKASAFQGGLIRYSSPMVARRRIKRIKEIQIEGEQEDLTETETDIEELTLPTTKTTENIPTGTPSTGTNEIDITFRDKWNHFVGWNENFRSIWMASLMEFIGCAVFVFFSVAIVVSTVNYFDIDPQVTGTAGNYKIFVMIGILHIVLLFLMIMSTAPASGAHLNSTITLATVVAGYTSLIRGLMYIIAQLSGSIVGAAIMRGVISYENAKKTNLGMCQFGGDVTSSGALGLEYMFGLFNLIVAFGTALDPRQRSVLGPMTGALFVSISVGMSIIAGGGIASSYLFGFNISRCFAPCVVMTDFSKFWPYVVGPLLAVFSVGIWVTTYPAYQYFGNFASIEDRNNLVKCKQLEIEKSSNKRRNNIRSPIASPNNINVPIQMNKLNLTTPTNK